MNAFVLIGLLAFATVFFGGVHVWSRSVLILAIFAYFPLSLWMGLRARGFAGSIRFPWSRKGKGPAPEGDSLPDPVHIPQPTVLLIPDPLSLMGIFFVVWGLLHLLPLPPSIVAHLSPEAIRLWSLVSPSDPTESYLLSLYPFMTLETLLLTLAFLLYYWAALYGLGDRKHLERIVLGILTLGVIESLYGLVQLAAGRNTILWWENPYSGNFVTGTFINRNHLAAFLSMAICLGIGYLWSLGRQERPETHRRGRRLRLREKLTHLAGIFGYRGVLVALALALMLAALLGSASRGGAISLVCGIVFMLGLILARYFRSRQGFVLMVVLSLVMAYTGYVATDRLAARLITFDAGLEGRIAMARDAWTMGQAFPLTGSGPGTFEFVFPRYQNVQLDKVVDHAHNDWVELSAEYGWVGLLSVFLALMAFLILTIGRWRDRHDGFIVGVGVGGIGAVVAIAVHSLSDFNLHIPANPLLLALILALTWRVLHSGRQGKAGYEGPAVSFNLSGRWRLGGVAVILVLLAAAAFYVIQTWRADAMARTFQNSTVAYRDPSPEKLRQARRLEPGNAAYWLWTAERLRMKPGESEALLTPEELLLPDPVLSLLTEGLRRNPTSWQNWREMAWTYFFQGSASGKNRAADLERAFRSIGIAASLRPADNRLRMESGTIALAAYSKQSPAASADDWQGPFRQVMQQNPKMAETIADLIVLHLGEKGAATLAEFLPPDTESHLNAAAFLLNQGYLEAGMDLVRRGEMVRSAQIERLWDDARRTGDWLEGKNAPQVQKVAALDSRHPGVLLVRGETIGALQSIERRGEPMEKWQNTRILSSRIEAEREAKKGDPLLQSYYLGLLAKEEGNQAKAVWWMNRTLNLKSQHFPAWLILRDLLKGQVRNEADQIQLDALETKIRLYSMDRIVFDAWKWAGKRAGRPTWSAPFRVAEKVGKVLLRFSGHRGTVWALELDGRFVEIWKGPDWEDAVTLAIPPGEHEFRLTTWSPELSGDGTNLPFRLEISWK